MLGVGLIYIPLKSFQALLLLVFIHSLTRHNNNIIINWLPIICDYIDGNVTNNRLAQYRIPQFLSVYGRPISVDLNLGIVSGNRMKTVSFFSRPCNLFFVRCNEAPGWPTQFMYEYPWGPPDWQSFWGRLVKIVIITNLQSYRCRLPDSY